MLREIDPTLCRPPVIPGYRLQSRVGQGAFGEVWLAEEALTAVRRAVKVMPRRHGGSDALLAKELAGVREYQQKSRNHPNLLQILHVGETEEFFYYVMELADNGALAAADEQIGNRAGHTGASDDAAALAYVPMTLDSVIQREAPMAAERALSIVADILKGIESLHGQGLIHRDVKPANVLFVDGRVKLGDMGLITPGDRDDISFVGTLGYRPAELNTDYTADLHAAGIILYEMLTGYHRSKFPELPVFRAMSRQERRLIRTAIHVMNKAAHPDRRQRYSSAKDVLRDIENLRSSGSFRFYSLAALALLGIGFAVAANMVSHRTADTGYLASSMPKEVRLVSAKAHCREVNTPSPAVILAYDDLTTRLAMLESNVVMASALDFNGDGNKTVVASFEEDGNHALIEFDPLKLDDRGRVFAPTRAFTRASLHGKPPTAWNHQYFDKDPSGAGIAAVTDLDGRTGDEIVVLVHFTECPTRIVVFRDDWQIMYEYWHYGQMSAKDSDIDGDGLKELICWGFANQVQELKPGEVPRAKTEPFFTTAMVLDPRTVAEEPGFWSINEWMNRDSQVKPLRYGYCPKQDPKTKRPSWNILTIEHHAAGREAYRIDLNIGWIISLDSRFDAFQFRDNATPEYVSLDPVPAPSEIWQRLYSADSPP